VDHQLTNGHNDDAFISPRQLAERWHVSLPTLWRETKRGRLPKPIRICAGTVRWRLGTIRAIEAAREAEAAGPPGAPA